MGCGATKENIESEILILRLMRTQIQEERAQILKELEKITGTRIIRPAIPDYLLQTEQSAQQEESKDKEDQKIKTKKKRKLKTKIRKKESTKADENEVESVEEEEEEEDEKEGKDE